MALGMIGGPEAVAGLRDALNCVSARIRARAAEYLGVVGDPTAIPDLIFHLGDADRTGVRRGYAPASWGEIPTKEFAALSLVKIAERSPDAVVSSLIEALRSPDALTRKNAAKMLAGIWDQRAIPALSDAFTYDADPDVRSLAANALNQIKTGFRWKTWDPWAISTIVSSPF